MKEIILVYFWSLYFRMASVKQKSTPLGDLVLKGGSIACASNQAAQRICEKWDFAVRLDLLKVCAFQSLG